jgi:hypothetical protein
VNVTSIDLDPLAFIIHFLNRFWIASRLACSLCDAMSGSLSVASTAVLSAKFAVIDSCEVGRSAMYNRYNNCHRNLFWCTSALTIESSRYSVSNFTRNSMQIEF